METVSVPQRFQPAPDIALTLPDGTVDSIRSTRFRQERVVFMLPSVQAAPGSRILAELESHRPLWEDWGTVAWVLTPESAAPTLPPGVRCARIGSTALPLFSGSEKQAIIALLDFRGKLMEAWRIGAGDSVDWRELGETIRWSALQEPECGICGICPEWEEQMATRS